MSAEMQQLWRTKCGSPELADSQGLVRENMRLAEHGRLVAQFGNRCTVSRFGAARRCPPEQNWNKAGQGLLYVDNRGSPGLCGLGGGVPNDGAREPDWSIQEWRRPWPEL